MVADEVDYVIGVDTHRDSHSAAVLEAMAGRVVGEDDAPACAAGYEQLLELGREWAPGARVWGIEGAGCYGAGLAGFLAERGERVMEVDRPKRAKRGRNGKSDRLDAIRAAREVLASQRVLEPRGRGERGAIRALLSARDGAIKARTQAINELKALRVQAPERLRAQLRALRTPALLARCRGLRPHSARTCEEQSTMFALRSLAKRIAQLEAEAKALEAELAPIIRRICPELIAEHGVGTLVAARLINVWSHPGRIRNEACFAKISGTAPLPASSGQKTRHRLSKEGDRDANEALHTILTVRKRTDPQTHAYYAKRTSQGKTDHEISRCLKRYIARHIFKILETHATIA